MMDTFNHETFLEIVLKDRNFFSFLEGIHDLDSYTKAIEKISEKELDKYSVLFETKYNFIGDLFEIFAEAFFVLNKADNRIGIYGYVPVEKSEDNGVDGKGIGFDGKPATVQIKFRGNPNEELHERDIKNFGYQSIVGFGVDKDTKTNMMVFTTAKGMHWYTESNVFLNRIRTVDRSMISSMVDNNECFWIGFRDMVKNTIKEKIGE